MNVPIEDALARDRDAFEAQKPTLLVNHHGKYALFYEGTLIDCFDSMDSAYEAGIQAFGLDRFYIGSVTEQPDEVHLPALTHGLVRAHL